MKPIHLRNVPPPPETFNHAEFICSILKWLKPECYLELGVRDGTTFVPAAKSCKKVIGVDAFISPQFEFFPNMEFHSVLTDVYFKNLDSQTKFDAVFIDADHSYDQSLKDFLNVKDRVIEDGFIFLHDTYPYDYSYITPDLCGEVHKTILFIKQNFIDDFEVLTLPFNPGVTIIKKMKRNKQLIYL